MAITCSVFIATSLDGFIARPDGGLDWLPGADGESGSEDYGYGAFFASIDTLVMGRGTYDVARAFREWPYHGKRVVVLSRKFPDLPVELADGVTGTSLQPAALVRRLELSGALHLYVDGGKTVQSFLNANLIDELTITRIPIVLGEGIPLFGPVARDAKLEHRSTRVYDNGFVQSTYRVVDRE